MNKNILNICNLSILFINKEVDRALPPFLILKAYIPILIFFFRFLSNFKLNLFELFFNL